VLRLSLLLALTTDRITDTQPFVDDLFNSLNTNSYIPGYVPPSKLSATAITFQPPPGALSAQPSFLSHGDQSRKRTREGSDVSNQYGRGYDGERAMKQSRRGGRGGRGGPNGAYNGSGYAQHQAMPQNMPSMPTPPPGFPPLDPNNPMAAIMAMQAMGFPSLPGFPGLPGSPAPNAPPLIPSIRQRCQDYDTKGYCAAGSNCPYEHGVDHIVLPGEGKENVLYVMEHTLTLQQSTIQRMLYSLQTLHEKRSTKIEDEDEGEGAVEVAVAIFSMVAVVNVQRSLQLGPTSTATSQPSL